MVKKVKRLNMRKEIKELIKQYNGLGEKIEDTHRMYVQKIYFTAKDKFQQIQKEEKLLTDEENKNEKCYDKLINTCQLKEKDDQRVNNKADDYIKEKEINLVHVDESKEMKGEEKKQI